jgi:hypothetical protein
MSRNSLFNKQILLKKDSGLSRLDEDQGHSAPD